MGRMCGVFLVGFRYERNSWQPENCTMEKTCSSVLGSVLAMSAPIYTLFEFVMPHTYFYIAKDLL